MPNSNTTYTPANSITVSQTGSYEVNYSVVATAALAAALTLAIRRNGTNIPQATLSRTLSAGTESIYSGSTIITLTAGDVIDMALSSLIAVGVTLGSGANAVLTIKKLD